MKVGIISQDKGQKTLEYRINYIPVKYIINYNF